MWFWMAIAIVTEVTATLSMRYCEGFTRLVPSTIVVLGYVAAFYAFSRAVMHGIHVSTAYAVWCGAGISIIAALGAVLFNERPTIIQLTGLCLVVVGVAALQMGAASNSASTRPEPEPLSSAAGLTQGCNASPSDGFAKKGT